MSDNAHWVCARLPASGVGETLLNTAGKPRRAYMPSHSLQQVALPVSPPDTVGPTTYAVAFGLTLIDDDTTRAEGVTFLPQGKKWLALALECIDVSSIGLNLRSSDDEPTREEMAMVIIPLLLR